MIQDRGDFRKSRLRVSGNDWWFVIVLRLHLLV